MTTAPAPPVAMTGATRFLAAVRREPVDRTPVWFMRQAGRCLAAYRELRETYDILTITRTPELCAQVTLMPVDEFGVDAAVLYATRVLGMSLGEVADLAGSHRGAGLVKQERLDSRDRAADRHLSAQLLAAGHLIPGADVGLGGAVEVVVPSLRQQLDQASEVLGREHLAGEDHHPQRRQRRALQLPAEHERGER